MNSFCTLFDSNYLTRGLAMYRSLAATGDPFVLYVFCFDDLCFDILTKLALPALVPISLADFETEELLRVKAERTAGEYCWTCTPHIIRHVLERYRPAEVTYLDADLLFFERPSLLLDEFHRAGGSVLITEHRYAPRYAGLAQESGIYCVQFITFSADARGDEALQWWQDRCIEWCFARPEEGKFGDQKYLDDWTERFPGVHVLQHLGGGVAPWNVGQYAVEQKNGAVTIDGDPLVFYHYHSFKTYADGSYDLARDYRFAPQVVNLFYRPYARALEEALAQVRTVQPGFGQGFSQEGSRLYRLMSFISRKMRGTYNVYRLL